MKCDLCDHYGEVTLVEDDTVRDKRMKRKFHYTSMHLCDACLKEWRGTVRRGRAVAGLTERGR